MNFVDTLRSWEYRGGGWYNAKLQAGSFIYSNAEGQGHNNSGSRLVIFNYNIKIHKLLYK